jgi:hypothetical protein
MKKLFVVVLLLICTNASAQVVEPKSGFGLAVRSGVSYFHHRFVGNGDFNYLSAKPALTFGGGVFYEKPLNNHLSLRTQLSYLERGSRETWDMRSVGGSRPFEVIDVSLKDRYISPDISLKYMFGNGTISPYAQAGLRSDIYLNSSVNSSSSFSSQTTQRSSGYRPVNLSGFVGIGFSAKRWDLGIEYNSSIFSVNNLYTETYRQNFRTLNLQLGYRF